MKKFLEVHPSGHVLLLEVFDTSKELEAIQKTVKGYVTVLGTPHADLVMWVNENGMTEDHRMLEVNEKATIIAYETLDGHTMALLGPAVLTGPADEDGETQSVPQWAIDEYLTGVRPDGPETAEGGLLGQMPY